jgi:site-specific DNA recombinase
MPGHQKPADPHWQGIMSPRDPASAESMTANRSALAGVISRTDILEAQLAKRKPKLDDETSDRFADLLREKLRGEHSGLRSACLRTFVAEVRVGANEIIISGPLLALTNGLAVGLPVKEGAVPIFDRKWCPEEDSNLHDLAIAST